MLEGLAIRCNHDNGRGAPAGARSVTAAVDQCDISTGTVIDDSITCVTPPQTSAVIRGRL